MNLAIHGLEGDVKHGGEINSYYDDPHHAVGRFDFVLANPPFNVNAVDKERLASATGDGKRYPLGLPRTDNANYLWIQLFYSSLNEKGRAGFVMANSASDARSSEQDIRQKLIEHRAVDVMVAVGPNMFYTVTLPCTLWFLDTSKSVDLKIAPDADEATRRRVARHTWRQDRVLFLDARHIYRQIDRAHRDWTTTQIGFLANVVRLYRGEDPDFTLGGDEAKAKIEELFVHNPSEGDAVSGNGFVYRDILGLCKAATIDEIAAQQYSLNPGRYVGVALGEEVSDEDFKERLAALNEELESLNLRAREFEATIAQNVAELLEA